MNEAHVAPVLALRSITRTYRQGGRTLEIFRDLDLQVAAGEVVALVGPSGAGKSSLLHIAGLLERPTGGTVEIAGRDCSGLGDGERTRMRRLAIGFVYQFHHLLPEFTALENVVLPQLIAGASNKQARDRAADLLDRLGLTAAQRPPAGRTVGRRTTARRHRPGARQPALAVARRRADG